jgi:hypothetical protein
MTSDPAVPTPVPTPVAQEPGDQSGSGAHDNVASEKPKPTDQVAVHVTFALSTEKAFKQEYSPETTLGTVRTAAMMHFHAQEDPNSTYYLTSDRQRHADSVTVGDLAGHAHALNLRMVKELTQGEGLR